MNLDEENIPRSEYYKQKILNGFPESQYAKVIRDPNYLDNENRDLIDATKLYEKAFIKYYQRGYYTQTVRSCDEIIANYSHTEIIPKVVFLKAMANGANGGEDAFRADLQSVITEFPNSEYSQRASDLLAGLDIKKEEERAQLAEIEKEKNQAEAVEKMDYKYEPNSKHNFVIIVEASGKELTEIKTAISDFNRQNYKMEGLKMSAIVYKRGMQMITVKSFSKAKQAKMYQTAFENNSKLQKIIAKNGNFFIVSFTNYALFYKPKDHVNYKMWADIKYKDL